jgi:hypothetical protein
MGIGPGSIVHLVTNQPPARDTRTTDHNFADTLSDEAIRAVLESTVSSASARRRQAVLQRRDSDITDRQEAVRQNLMSIRGICDTMSSNGFDRLLRHFQIGQWVDV